MKRGRKPQIDAAGKARAIELAEQGMAQKQISDRLAAEGFGAVTQSTISRLLCSRSRIATARRTKVERRTKSRGTRGTPAPRPDEPETVPGWDSLPLRTLRTKLEQAEEMSVKAREAEDGVEWGRLARTIAAIASKIEAREDELRAREEQRQRERQSRREAADAAADRQSEALVKLRAMLARQDEANVRHR